jgi:hypothetical protein
MLGVPFIQSVMILFSCHLKAKKIIHLLDKHRCSNYIHKDDVADF